MLRKVETQDGEISGEPAASFVVCESKGEVCIELTARGGHKVFVALAPEDALDVAGTIEHFASEIQRVRDELTSELEDWAKSEVAAGRMEIAGTNAAGRPLYRPKK